MNGINEAGWKEISECLEVNDRLEELNIGYSCNNDYS